MNRIPMQFLPEPRIPKSPAIYTTYAVILASLIVAVMILFVVSPNTSKQRKNTGESSLEKLTEKPKEFETTPIAIKNITDDVEKNENPTDAIDSENQTVEPRSKAEESIEFETEKFFEYPEFLDRLNVSITDFDGRDVRPLMNFSNFNNHSENFANRRSEILRIPISIHDVVLFECSADLLEPEKNITWIPGSDEEIWLTDHLGETVVMNVTSGKIYRTPKYTESNESIFSDSRKSVTPENPGENNYTHIHEEKQQHWRHRCHYKIRTPTDSNIPTKSCNVDARTRYILTWNPPWFQPKYSYQLSANCASYEVDWLDEYTPMGKDVQNYFTNEKALLMLKSELQKHPKKFSRYKRTNRSETSKDFQKSSIELIDIDFTIPYPKYAASVINDMVRNHFVPARVGKSDNVAFSPGQAVKIGETPWILHKINCRDPRTGRRTANLAISDQTSFLSQKNKDSCRPVLTDKYFVTEVLKVKTIGDDEAIAYFLASPATNVSLKHLYRTKIVYPPVEFATLETTECLTCPTNYSNEDELDIQGPGQSPQCLWSEIAMSQNTQRYILYCGGPFVPWTAVVDINTNLIIRFFDGHQDIRNWEEHRILPFTQEFEIDLGSNVLARGKIYSMFAGDIFSNDSECERKLRLLVRIADDPKEKLITTKYKIGIVEYLSSNEGYLVLEVDIEDQEEQLAKNYVELTNYITNHIRCIESVGIFGEFYGGHKILDILKNDYNDIFKCGVLISPYAENWNKTNFEDPKSNLKNKKVIVYTGLSIDENQRFYENNLLESLPNFRHRKFFDAVKKMCDSRVQLYTHMSNHFKSCFHGI